ncbi:TPA: radical SAM protein [Candidatus Bathyarchaeota archaeon]|nr:radical SAM protein [Candidatus Bathyarchaeota archaeon]
MEVKELIKPVRILRETKSICPTCFKAIPAKIFVDEKETVRMGKTCPEHGYFEDTYTFSKLDDYLWAERYARKGTKIENPRTETSRGCPYDCGLCPQHESHTVLAIIDVTNRCNLRCPICFANAAAAGYVYQPSKEQIREIMVNLRANRPVAPPALQLSGGEPTVREDLPELIRMAKELGFSHVEVNTNGIRFARDVKFFEECLKAGMSTVYLQFDGLKDGIYEEVRGVPLMETKLKVLENARKIGLESIVLVVTLVRGFNDDQLGDILRFAMKNSDVVRCINVQPVSITGRIDKEVREKMRINTSDFMELLEKQSNGLVKASDFKPVPCVIPIAKAVGLLRGKHYVEFSTAPWCGVATFLVKTDGGWIPITRLANVDKFFEAMEGVAKEASRGRNFMAKLRLLTSLRHVKAKLIKEVLWPILKEGSYDSLANFMRRILMIGCMHFMDPYNFDLDRVQRCTIHYGLPDGTIRPFCSYNSIHRAELERKLSVA